MLSYAYALSFLISFLVCFAFMGSYIRRALDRGIVGVDVHKSNKPKVAESGGIVLAIGCIMGLFAIIPFTQGSDSSLQSIVIAATSTISICALIGFVDDMLSLPWRIKALTPLIAGVPLAVMRIGNPIMVVPLLGAVDFGVWYYVMIAPLEVSVLVNTVNMYAGLNGLEAGSCLIVMSGLAYIAAAREITAGLAVLVPCIGGCLAFLYYNRYPSRVFPGDVGTFTLGAAIACAAILGNLERATLVASSPLLINAIMVLVGVFLVKRSLDIEPEVDGRFVPTSSLWAFQPLLVWIKRMDERGLTVSLLLIVAASTIASLLLCLWS
ncbi:MAG: hypothetical protein ACE5OY_03310 [Candidatus Bathyarchaeia archaeon]